MRSNVERHIANCDRCTARSQLEKIVEQSYNRPKFLIRLK